jgi:hypothetical protein
MSLSESTRNVLIGGFITWCLTVGGFYTTLVRTQENHQLRITANETVLQQRTDSVENTFTNVVRLQAVIDKIDYHTIRIDGQDKFIKKVGDSLNNIHRENGEIQQTLQRLNSANAELIKTVKVFSEVAVRLDERYNIQQEGKTNVLHR